MFWPFLISRWRIQFRLFVLPGPKQYPDPRAVLPEMRVECQEEKLDFFFGGGKSPKHPPSIAAATEGVAGAVGCGTASQTQSVTQSEIYDCVDPERVAYLILWKRLKSVAGDEFARLNTGVLLTRENRAGREPKW